MELGLYSFGDLTPDPATGRMVDAATRLGQMVEAAARADEAGFAVFGVGEHHRLDFAVSATPVVMAAMAARTRRIRLSSAVTILSTADPVRVFEDFATVDLLSGGRAEIVAGRGAFVESFPLFGHSLDDYDALFAEKLDLLLKLNAAERVAWSGRFRPALKDAEIAPRPRRPLPVWIGTGGAPESAVRAGTLGLPLALANISLPPARLAPVVASYRQAGDAAGHPAAALRVGLSAHLHLAGDSQAARERFYPHYAAYFATHSPDRAKPMAVTRETFDARAAPDGPLFVGSPQEIVDKIEYERELFGHERFSAQIDIGGLPQDAVLETLELLAAKVMPALAT